MIEKLKEHEITDKTGKVLGTIGCDLQEVIDKINELVDTVNELQMKVGHLEDGVVCKVFDNDDTDDIAEVKNENLYTKSMRMDKEFAEEEMERLQKELARTKKQLEIAVDALKKYTDASGNWWYGYEF